MQFPQLRNFCKFLVFREAMLHPLKLNERLRLRLLQLLWELLGVQWRNAFMHQALLIAEQIRKWYLEYKQHKSGKKIAKVLIVGKNGERLILEGATAEQIQRILSS